LRVAPLAGAWIETCGSVATSLGSLSHPSRVRGLKLSKGVNLCQEVESHPSRVRGLKLCSATMRRVRLERSHPSRVRGLKLLVLPVDE